MRKPDFILGGATRSGLSTLTQILDEHPQVFIPHRKENQFFKQSKIENTGLDTCKIDFEDAVHSEYKVRIPEHRSLHCEHEYDPERAHAGCPNAKVIFTLRNPVERVYLQFHHALSEKKETVRTLEHAMEAELSGLRTPDTTGRCWIFKNQYQTHLEEWLNLFPRENILILIYEEWADPTQTKFQRIEDFLGLKPNSLLTKEDNGGGTHKHLVELAERNNKKKFPPLLESTKEQLEEILSIDKTYVRNLLNRDIEAWK